jgi:hypothetical protein
MTEESLNQENRKTLRENITQTLAMFLIIAFASSLVLGAIYIVFRDNESLKLPFHTIWIFWFSVIIFLFVYGYFIIKQMRLQLLDYLKGKKKTKFMVLLSKRNNIKYTYHANTIVDFKQQPVLNEYFFKFDDFELQVNKEDYNNFNRGDTLLLSFAYYSNRLIQLEIFNEQL